MKVLLLVVYISSIHPETPTLKTYHFDDYKVCNAQAKQIYENVKAGTVRAWCHKQKDSTK